MTDYILCALGIFIYFLNRYANRANKSKSASFNYWVKDNMPELLTTLSLNIAIMVIIHLPGTAIDMNPLFASLPFGLSVAGKPVLSFFLGLGLTATFYRLFRTKTK